MTDPFDRSLPSPIGLALQLRASSDAAVVEGDRTLSDLQQRMRVATDLETRIADVARSGEVAAIFISGSAGGGKSLLIGSLRRSDPDAFGSIIEDATHSDSPSERQYQRLVRVLAPLADGAPTYAGKPLLIAMNTGMVIRFFDQLREVSGDNHEFTALEAELKRRLNLRHGGSLPLRKLPGTVVVVNLDHRATTGGPASLFDSMLRATNPDVDGSVLDGRRCVTCTVRERCFVRTNAQLISSDPARAALDGAADAVAFDRGRPLQPRALWDLISDLLTGGEPFTEADPCDRIASLTNDPAGEEVVFWRLAVNGIFRRPDMPLQRPGRRRAAPSPEPPRVGRRGGLARWVAGIDPSYKPGVAIHRDLADVGIEPSRDRERFVRLLGGEEAAREAVIAGAAGLERILRANAQAVPAAARAMVRAGWMSGETKPEPVSSDFMSAAASIGAGRLDDEAVDRVRQDVIAGLATAFGSNVGERFFFRTEAYDPDRDWEILVEIDLESSDEYLAPYDPVLECNSEGAEMTSYRPMSICFRLPGGGAFAVDAQLHRLLRMAASGTQLSSADLERSYQLRRAAEVIGLSGARDERKALLLFKRSEGRQFLIFQRRQAFAARELHER
jgi:hypothetical protein